MDAERVIEEALRGAPARDLPDVAATAQEAGLLDVAYCPHETPVGRLLLASTPAGVVRLAYSEDDEDDQRVLATLARKVSPRILAAGARLDQARRELDEYFAGRRRRFELALDWQLTRGFGRDVLRATARIPFGGVSNYLRVAGEAGSPRGARAAGNALGANPLPIIVPCHRVLTTGGGLGGYTGGTWRKQVLLQLEGVAT